MGLALPQVLMLLMEHRSTPFHGTILQIGRQDMYLDYEMLQRCANHLGVKLTPVEPIVCKPNEWMPGVNTIDDITFFKSIGFDTVLSIDASDYENADLVWDFNKPVPDELKNRYDVILDGGSLEHIFNVGTAFMNMAAMLRENGRAIHVSPMHNFVDHGFFSFSPTLFHDFYEMNNFSAITLHMLGHKIPFNHNEIPKVIKYTPGMLEPFSVGGFTRERWEGYEMFGIYCTATKTANSTCDVVPMQRRYREWWKSEHFNQKLKASSAKA